LSHLLLGHFDACGAGFVVAGPEPAAAAAGFAPGFQHLRDEQGLELLGGFADFLGIIAPARRRGER
jgi:hypothetical protein